MVKIPNWRSAKGMQLQDAYECLLQQFINGSTVKKNLKTLKKRTENGKKNEEKRKNEQKLPTTGACDIQQNSSTSRTDINAQSMHSLVETISGNITTIATHIEELERKWNDIITRYTDKELSACLDSIAELVFMIEIYEDRIDQNIGILYQLEKDFQEKLHETSDYIDQLSKYAWDVYSMLSQNGSTPSYFAHSKLNELFVKDCTTATSVESLNDCINGINGEFQLLQIIVHQSDDSAHKLNNLLKEIY